MGSSTLIPAPVPANGVLTPAELERHRIELGVAEPPLDPGLAAVIATEIANLPHAPSAEILRLRAEIHNNPKHAYIDQDHPKHNFIQKYMATLYEAKDREK